MQVQETTFVSDFCRRPGSSLATHLAINNGSANIIDGFRHNLDNLIASHVISTLDAIGYTLKLIFDLL